MRNGYPIGKVALEGTKLNKSVGMGIKQIIGVAVGALVGFLFGYLGRCAGGTA